MTLPALPNGQKERGLFTVFDFMTAKMDAPPPQGPRYGHGRVQRLWSIAVIWKTLDTGTRLKAISLTRPFLLLQHLLFMDMHGGGKKERKKERKLILVAHVHLTVRPRSFRGSQLPHHVVQRPDRFFSSFFSSPHKYALFLCRPSTCLNTLLSSQHHV